MARGGKTLNKLTIIGLVLAVVGFVGTIAGVLAADRSGEPSNLSSSVDGVMEHSPFDLDGFDLDFDGSDESAVPDDPGADDGELHDARKDVDGYTIVEGYWASDGVEHLDAYDMNVECLFSVNYPTLVGDLENIDQINDLLRSTAMATVQTYYENPSEQTVEMVRKAVAEATDEFKPEHADAMLYSEVQYAISYNDEHLLSVCFSDEYCAGTSLAGTIQLRTVNVNLQTGETYELADVLSVKRSMATSFVDNLVQTSGEDENGDGTITDDECLTVVIGGRDEFERALRGRGELANTVSTCLYVDGNKHVNLGANYLLNRDGSVVRGWWDVTLTDRQVAAGKIDSEFWDLLGQ